MLIGREEPGTGSMERGRTENTTNYNGEGRVAVTITSLVNKGDMPSGQAPLEAAERTTNRHRASQSECRERAAALDLAMWRPDSALGHAAAAPLGVTERVTTASHAVRPRERSQRPSLRRSPWPYLEAQTQRPRPRGMDPEA